MFTNQKEQEFFLEKLNKNQRVLEWGSGESTIDISYLVKEIVSIEHQKEWFKTVQKNIFNKKIKNAFVYLLEPDEAYSEGGHDGTYDQFKSYINFPINKGNFQVILIDGRARVECAKIAKLISDKNTLIFIHDFIREEYQIILEFLEVVDFYDTMYLFKIK